MEKEGLIPTAPSRLEAFIEARRPPATRTLSASHAEPLSLPELLALADEDARARFDALPLGYAETRGGDAVREAIAGLYPPLTAEDVATFAGAQEAIFAVLAAEIRPGDRVVTFRPAYPDLIDLPRDFGAELVTVPLSSERGFAPDLDAFEAALGNGARLVILNFPHNPTGATVDEETLRTMTAMAEAEGARVFSDEVYRLLAHDPAERLPPVAAISERGVSLDVMSKAFGLGGVRVGWIATRDRDLLRRAIDVKTRLSICNGATDEALAAIAIGVAEEIVGRNLGIVRRNLDRLDELLAGLAERFSWRRPAAGCLGFLGLVDGTDPVDFADALAREEGLLILPAGLFHGGEPGFRLGFGRADLPELLPAFERFARNGRGGPEA